MSTKIQLPVNSSEVERVFEPYIAKKFSDKDKDWQTIRRDFCVKQKLHRLRHCLFSWVGRYRRTQEGIEGGYNVVWKMPLEEQVQKKFSKPVPCEFGGRGLLAYGYGIKKVHHLLLSRAIQEMKPRRVLEVGCGNGLNLFILSNLFPEIEFTGLELTKAGVDAVKEMQARPQLPQALEEFSVEKFIDSLAFKRVNVVQGNAAKMPFSENSFDLVYTVLALEQMEEVRDAAMGEIGRVTGKHAIMIEPFRDWNQDGLRRDYIVSMDYFSARVKDLPKFGLNPVLLKDDLPNKLNLGVGFVLSEKIK